MPALSLIASICLALPVQVVICKLLRRAGAVRRNYRAAEVAFPGGLALATSVGVSVWLAGLCAGCGIGVGNFSGLWLLYFLGVSALGLVDDLFGLGAGSRWLVYGRGLRGHARTLLQGGVSTGLLKALGAFVLALFVLRGTRPDTAQYLLAVAVVVALTNLFNMFDLRPGRCVKAFCVLGAVVTLGSGNLRGLWAFGPFIGPVLAWLPLDLRERAMLGDTGSNAVGAVAGLWVASYVPVSGQLATLCVVVLITIYGEFRSLSELIERTPLLRRLDSLGRVSHA
jgi:UDP-N-acetylmuramyl pentapeptide phosphotransferase/UDP-N-acetylglucosamine-1-phosphate transferase